MVIGNFINEERLWDIFDEIDCIIASEDMCNSSRYFENIKLSAGAEEVSMQHLTQAKNRL